MTRESALARKPAFTDRRSPAPSAMIPKSIGSQSSAADLLRQRVGNQAFQVLKSQRADEALRRSQSSQAKFAISQPRDVHEQEADRVADAVMRMPSPDMQQMPAVSSAASMPEVQRMCAECEEELGKNAGAPVRRKEQTADVPPITPSVDANIRALRGGGSALPTATRAFFEPRFGADFSDLRVHTGARADEAAESIGARAFTIGRNIVFGAGQYAPESQQGRTLLAHELTHTVQQAGAGGIHEPIQQKVDEESFAKRGGKIEEVGDTTGGGFGEGTSESNEFLLWNYNVGSPEPRAGHRKYLKEKVLTPTRWPNILRGDPGLKVAIVGGASSTGGAAITTPLSVVRADNIKAVLVSGGIDAKRIVTSGVGSRHPFADETNSENMARNRRVEVFLFRPTQRVAS